MRFLAHKKQFNSPKSSTKDPSCNVQMIWLTRATRSEHGTRLYRAKILIRLYLLSMMKCLYPLLASHGAIVSILAGPSWSWCPSCFCVSSTYLWYLHAWQILACAEMIIGLVIVPGECKSSLFRDRVAMPCVMWRAWIAIGTGTVTSAMCSCGRNVALDSRRF